LEEMILVKCINLYNYFAFFALGFVWILDKLEIKAPELMLFSRKYMFMYFCVGMEMKLNRRMSKSKERNE
jgi:hypothetical protein